MKLSFSPSKPDSHNASKNLGVGQLVKQYLKSVTDAVLFVNHAG